jgi:hypothetical protein
VDLNNKRFAAVDGDPKALRALQYGLQTEESCVTAASAKYHQ